MLGGVVRYSPPPTRCHSLTGRYCRLAMRTAIRNRLEKRDPRTGTGAYALAFFPLALVLLWGVVVGLWLLIGRQQAADQQSLRITTASLTQC